jgi:WD40 repeat protein
MRRQTYSAIRHLAAPYDGPRIAGAEFAYTVYVWDLNTRKRISVFESPLDFGGRRLAINPRGDICAVASYTLGGLACYAADSGEVVCVRDDLKKLQTVSYSPDGKRLYCGSERGPMTVLDAETGSDIAKYPAIDHAYCSPYEPIELLSKRRVGPIELRRIGGKRIATFERTGFAIHGVAFGTDRLCMSEAGGGNPFRSDNARPLLRCVDTQSGAELWRYTPPLGWNIPRLSYAQKAMAFFGIEKPYLKGGKKRLLRFNPDSGKSTRVAGIEKPCATEVFCSCGESLLTSEGELIDVVAGTTKRAFRFPSNKDTS